MKDDKIVGTVIGFQVGVNAQFEARITALELQTQIKIMAHLTKIDHVSWEL